MHRNILFTYLLILIIAVILSSFFHEFAHWTMYKILGYDANLTINTVNLINTNVSLSKTERMLTSFSGPFFTIIQAVLFYFILKKHKNIYFYPFLFYPFVYRFGAGIANVFQPNDEGRVSLALHLNLYTLSVIVVSFLFFLVYKISKRNHYSLLFNLGNFLVLFILMILISYLDAKFHLQII